MALTFAQASQYVSRAALAPGSQAPAASSQTPADALAATAEDWNSAPHLFAFTLVETPITLATTTLTAAITASATSITVHSSTGFVNGMTLLCEMEQMTLSSFSGSSDPYTFTVVRGVNGTTAAAHQGDSIVAVRDYTCPSDFNAPYDAVLWTARLPLTYWDKRRIDRDIWDQCAPGTPNIYTVCDAGGFQANAPTQYLRVMAPPSAADMVTLTYYRRIAPQGDTAGNLDVPPHLSYLFLDMAVARYLQAILPGTPENLARIQLARRTAQNALENAIARDRVAEEDKREAFVSRFQAGLLGPNTGTGGWPLPTGQ